MSPPPTPCDVHARVAARPTTAGRSAATIGGMRKTLRKTQLHTPMRLHERLVDVMIEAYVGWREACALVRDAHGTWASAPRAGAQNAFEVYLAALDEEERAAALYASVVRRVEEVAA